MDKNELRSELYYMAVALEGANAIKAMLAYEGENHELVLDRVVFLLDRGERKRLHDELARYDWGD